MNFVTHEHLETAMSYADYRALIDRLLDDGKTTGSDHSEQMLEYTRLNVHRMNRIDRTISLATETVEALRQVRRPVTWLVLTEAWCGDAAQNLPIIAKMADTAPMITLKILLRDEHLEIMDHLLTNGGRAIPKLACLTADTLSELGTWGPRPEPAQAMVRAHKANPTEPYSEFVKKVQLWYAHDKGRTIQAEFRDRLRMWHLI